MGMKGATLSGVATKASESLVRNLSRLGDVSARKMFGGYGLFFDGAMFALISGGEELFLKADDENRQAFLERGSKTHGKMPYYAVPAEALNGWREMAPWAEGAVAASKRAKSK